MKRLPLILVAVAFALGFLPAVVTQARSARRVEVVEVTGIIDSPAEHAIDGAIKDANREKAQLVVIQLNSRGAVGADRVRTSLTPSRVRAYPSLYGSRRTASRRTRRRSSRSARSTRRSPRGRVSDH
jgi:hypothetical protein